LPSRALAIDTKNPPSPVKVWGAQLAGTVAIAIALWIFLGDRAPMIRGVDPQWVRFGLVGILAAATPALWYLRRFSAALNADLAASRARGMPDPARRVELLRKLSVGGALCELPLALGVIYLLAGAEKSLFLAAACVSIAMRLSYRPFRGTRR
jgi:hypothetical protein